MQKALLSNLVKEGGGFRIYSSLVVLRYLEQLLESCEHAQDELYQDPNQAPNENPGKKYKLHEYFDYIAGVDTGG
jgi:hypothetical protein